MPAPLTYTRRKTVPDLTPAEYRELRGLNFRSNGLMQERLSELRASRDETAEVIVTRRRSDKKVVGWAMVHHWESEKKRTVYFYVRRDERRKGYGSRLMAHARKLEPVPLIDPHDNTSKKFFVHFKNTVEAVDNKPIG